MGDSQGKLEAVSPAVASVVFVFAGRYSRGSLCLPCPDLGFRLSDRYVSGRPSKTPWPFRLRSWANAMGFAVRRRSPRSGPIHGPSCCQGDVFSRGRPLGFERAGVPSDALEVAASSQS